MTSGLADAGFEDAPDPLRRQRLALLSLLLALPIALIVGASIGSVAIPPRSWLALLSGEPDALGRIALSIRLPRIAAGAAIGAALAAAGASLQAIFRNPLADAGLTGPATGATLAVVATIVLAGARGPALVALPVAATLGCALTTLLVYRLGRSEDGEVSVARLLLAGIGINALAGASMGLLVFMAEDPELRSIQFWMLGSLSGLGWLNVAIMAPALALAGAMLLGQGRALDAFSLGESEAFAAGVDTRRLKRMVIAATALATGAAVAFSGLIGFVGLVAPHCVRLLGGPRHVFVLPASALLGAILVVLADCVARIAVVPAELPIGIVTSLLGAPVFIMLLRSREVRA